MQPLILIVEDDSAARSSCAELLQSHGFRVVEVATAAAARAAAAEHVPDLALIDVVLPDGDGLGLATELRERPGAGLLPIIAYTGQWSADHARRARQSGVFATLMKPAAPAHLLSEIYRALAGPDAAGQMPYQE
jgi:CheY-like chemotaxis protein